MPPLAAQGASSVFAATSAADQSNEKTSKSRTIRVLRTVKHHVKHHVGIGIVCSVAYFDPGNWSVDLQAGSQFGYRPLLFIILLAGLGAIILQSLASKLGCVTGQDLASHCRLLLHDRPKHRKLVRYSILYPLYVLSEIGIVCTDLAELLGSAIGLCLLFPSIPLWAAVLVTAADVLVFLVIGGPTRGGKPVKVFEYVIIALVFTVFACFIVLLVQVKPQWSSVFLGYIPSEKLFDTHTDVLYIAVGILGATVMPHALFLGSFLATQDRTASTVDVSLPYPIQADEKAASYTLRARLRTWFKSLFDVSRAERIAASREYRTKYGRENNELSFIRGHLTHGIVDIVTSLIGVAVPINSAILILAAAVFFKSNGESSMPASLFDAHQLIVDRIGNAAGVVFALALLFAGQTSSITATLAGQVVSEGFIEWHISPFLRRLVTRMIGLVPSMVVAIAVGRTGINTLLVASQVALSVVLPFVAFPLIWLTSSKSIMSVRVPHKSDTFSNTTHVHTTMTLDTPPSVVVTQDESSVICESVQEVERPSLPEKADDVHVENVAVSPDDDEYIDFSNGRLLTLVSVLIFIIVLAANLYVFVMLGLGRA